MKLALVSLSIVDFDFAAESPYLIGSGLKLEVDYFLMQFFLVDGAEGMDLLKLGKVQDNYFLVDCKCETLVMKDFHFDYGPGRYLFGFELVTEGVVQDETAIVSPEQDLVYRVRY